MIEGPFGALFFCPQGSRPAGFLRPVRTGCQEHAGGTPAREAPGRDGGTRAHPPTHRHAGKEMLVSVLTLGTGTAPSPCSEKRIDCSEAGRRMMARKCLISLAKVLIVRMFFYSEYTYIG